ncbi:MAG: integrase family protein [Gemmatimonadetes bacterium]|nr:integrase family protein [Gemmatimonadota bacterium]
MLRVDPVRKTYSAEIKHRTFGRVHLRLQTKLRDTAMKRHAALQQLLDTGEPVRDVVEALRARKLSILAVEECVRAKLPFDSLRPSAWPALGAARDLFLKAVGARDQGSEATTASNKTALDRAVLFFGEEKPLESITYDDVAAWKADMLATSDAAKADGRKALHTNTVGLYLTKLGAVFTFLQEREEKRARQAKRTPATLFSPLDREDHVPAVVQTRVRFLAEPEAQLVLTATPPSLEIAIACGIFAGLRVGEMMMLRPWVDLNLERGVIYIQSREGQAPHRWFPKYRRNREVPISAALRPYVERHLATLPAGAPYVLPGFRPGLPMGVQSIHEAVRRIVTDAGLEPGRKHQDGITYHTLRHTFASWLVMAGADLLTISRLMGHKGIGQIEDTYGHLSPMHLRGTVELLANRWFAAPSANQTPLGTP